ncbi:MAG: ABC transporter permease [Acetobacteraceae bacterium]|nr:ABC transporter permease [Acetobacteraceae bacterium]
MAPSPLAAAGTAWRPRPFATAMAWAGRLVFCVAIAVAALAPFLAPHGEAAIVGGAFEPWSGNHWLGTDALGRDIASRMIHGARTTIGIAAATTFLSALIGCTTGLLAATVGRLLDQVLSRIVDVLISVPQLIFALLALTIFGTSTLTLIGVTAALDSTRFFRFVRSAAVGVAVLDYVEAARLRGERLAWIMGREILPNIAVPVAAEFGSRFGFVFLFIASLSFLGLGIQPPLADWGSMVRETSGLLAFGEITPVIPALAIALVSVSVAAMVDWLVPQGSDR